MLAAFTTVWMLGVGGCSDPPTTDGDGDVDTDVDGDGDVDTDVDGDGDGDGDADQTDGGDGDVPTGPGSITLVIRDVNLSSVAVCDFDEDGDLDNVFADLGSPLGEMAALGLNSVIRIDTSVRRILLHMPLVEDLSGPTDPVAQFLGFEGIDLDDPPDTSDDFSGEEEFHADPTDLDGCGEPLHFFRDVRIDGGEINGHVGSFAGLVTEGLPMDATRIQGTIEPGGTSAAFTLCFYAPVGALGMAPGPDMTGDLTMLEVFLAGGAALGIPVVPGFTPDVDVDGDGLERFILDGDFHIESCIDGDRTTTSGRECWRTAAFADAFAFTINLPASPARFAGRKPGWEDEVDGTCESGPPEPSMWDPI